MSLILLNLQSNQEIKLDTNNPLIIGRGNVQGCTDKRVSRNHGRITSRADGKILLEPLHSNPCFITRNGVPPVVQLNKNQAETLSEGDCLGLLPHAFWFQITSRNGSNIKENNNNSNEIGLHSHSKENNITDVLKIEENNIHTNEIHVEKVILKEPEVYDSSNKNQYSVSVVYNQSCSSPAFASSSNTSSSSPVVENSSLFGSPGFEKTRKLPLWMYEIHTPKETNSPNKRALSNNEESAVKKGKTSLEKKSSEESQSLLPDSCSIKVRDENEVMSSESTSEVKITYESSKATSSSSNGSPQKPSLFTNGESSKQNQMKEGYESNINDEASANNKKRPFCQYEDKCYRKNSQHKLDFCHPGDPDFVSYEDRPMCQYGASCYRKSEIHKLEYRHPPARSSSQTLSSPCSSCSASPLPSKRKRKTVMREYYDYEDDFDSDQDNPFLNDDSSDEFFPDSVSMGYDTSFDYSPSDLYLDDSCFGADDF